MVDPKGRERKAKEDEGLKGGTRKGKRFNRGKDKEDIEDKETVSKESSELKPARLSEAQAAMRSATGKDMVPHTHSRRHESCHLKWSAPRPCRRTVQKGLT